MNTILKKYCADITQIITIMNTEINNDYTYNPIDHMNYPSTFVQNAINDFNKFKIDFNKFYEENKSQIDEENLYYIKIQQIIKFNIN